MSGTPDDEISQPGRRATITQSTQVRLPLGRAWAILVGATMVAAAAVAGYYGLSGTIDSHTHNGNVHLSDTYYRVHGDVIGQFDLQALRNDLGARIDDLRREVARIDDLRKEVTSLRENMPSAQHRARARGGE